MGTDVMWTLPHGSVHGCSDSRMPNLIHGASGKVEEFVDQFGNCFLRLAAFHSLFLSMALDIYNLRKARW
jgi:hypothetical protein